MAGLDPANPVFSAPKEYVRGRVRSGQDAFLGFARIRLAAGSPQKKTAGFPAVF